jgi:hypothetical protein
LDSRQNILRAAEGQATERLLRLLSRHELPKITLTLDGNKILLRAVAML